MTGRVCYPGVSTGEECAPETAACHPFFCNQGRQSKHGPCPFAARPNGLSRQSRRDVLGTWARAAARRRLCSVCTASVEMEVWSAHDPWRLGTCRSASPFCCTANLANLVKSSWSVDTCCRAPARFPFASRHAQLSLSLLVHLHGQGGTRCNSPSSFCKVCVRSGLLSLSGQSLSG